VEPTTDFVDEHGAATFLGTPVQTLRRWRQLRTGPAFFKIGKRVRYSLADLRAYIQRQRVETV
jgi:hypothetical protein